MYLTCGAGGDSGGEHDMTCGDIRDLYREQRCCGNPSRPFAVPEHRRLAPARPAASGADAVDAVR
eukprot:CAMPEP_0179333070 /NCGR_PEP_ID=MMETSP0797-20121207/65091_1 /TAXON_ID=47934 /ORGANISM="Dinophysis acuminata, Strain DAEP01" /LENGTH=64 /DNA_ID=CAMNT_0021046021 /DNA_START=18 /DNA_END=208 /DNA_ORIENTATION=-